MKQILFALVLAFGLTPLVSHADLYADRAQAEANRSIGASMEKARRWLLSENTGSLRRVRSFVAKHGGSAGVANCQLDEMRCQPDGDSFDCFPKFKAHQVNLEEIDPGADSLWMHQCRLDLGDGLACQTDRDNKTASCYDAAGRARSLRL